MLEQFDVVVFIVDKPSTSAKKVLGGGLINEVGVGGGEGLITGLFKTTAFQNKLHSSADQNTF